MILHRLNSSRVPTDLNLALRSPWCNALQSTGPLSGETCLVAVSDARSSLWVLRNAPYRFERGRAPFVGSAAEALQEAQHLAMRHLPLLLKLEPQPGAWYAELLYKEGDKPEHCLDGPSFGLSMCLAVASRLLGEPVPSSFAASACLRKDGSLAEVSGLDQKLAMIEESAFGIKTFLVAKEQEEEAQSILACLRANRSPALEDRLQRLREWPLQICGVSHVREAFAMVWPSLEETFRARWQNPQRARQSIDELFLLAIDNPPSILDWQGVSRAAALLQQRVPPDSIEKTKAYIAEQIAKRHEDRAHQLPWPEVRALKSWSLPLRLKLLSHVVQAAADTDFELAQRYTRVVREQWLFKPFCEMSPEELRLCGATGRALASAGEHEQACVYLKEALDGWVALFEWEQATFPLSEYLRLLGVLNRKEELFAVLEKYIAPMSGAHCSDTGLGFVYVAAGRALWQCGEPEQALRYLREERIDWEHTPDHLQRACWRWRVLALHRLGQDAAPILKKLNRQTDDQSVLLALEGLSGGALRPALQKAQQQAEAAKKEWGRELLRTCERLGFTLGDASEAQLQKLLREYRY